MERFRVLFVDDEEELVSTMVRRLTMRGIDAEYVLNGEKALKAVHDKDFDLVIMDLNIAGMTGLELMKRIKRNNQNIKFIFLTGYGFYNKEMPEIKAGASDCLLKPINIEALIKRMEEVVG